MIEYETTPSGKTAVTVTAIGAGMGLVYLSQRRVFDTPEQAQEWAQTQTKGKDDDKTNGS